MSELLPILKKIRVNPEKLYLDPNNPRFLSKDEDRIDERSFLDEDVVSKTAEKMKRKEFNYSEIKKSILANGWQPVDFIFVRRFNEAEERYVVLEGNRRITAVKDILRDADTPTEIREQLAEIDVMEIIDKVKRSAKSRRDLDKKISYLLGVRHHGSLKTWSPFAQAQSIYQRYLSLAKQDDDTFQWDKSIAEKLSQVLSMDEKDVLERIKVYRTMQQVGLTESVKASEGQGGGMKGHYYSVCKEAVSPRGFAKHNYILQDAQTFLLEPESIGRLINLCHFDKPDRKAAPIKNPQQWRFLGEILKDGDAEKRAANLERVEVNKELPENVWAERYFELKQPKWDLWLKDAAGVFKSLNLGQLTGDRNSEQFETEKRILARVVALIDQLGEVEDGN